MIAYNGKQCRWVVTWNGSEIKFETEQDLDDWIFSHRDILLSNLDRLNIVPELNKKESVTQVIRNTIGGVAARPDVKQNNIANTTLWGSINPMDIYGKYGSNIKSSYIEALAEDIMQTEKKPDGSSYTKEEALKIAKAQSKPQAKAGSIFHKILELKISKKWKTNSANIYNDPLNDIRGINLSNYTEEIKFADHFIAELTKKYEDKFGKDSCEFISEANLVSDQIDPNMLPIIKALTGNDNTKWIFARADLLVVRPDGMVDVYDFKTSIHAMPKDWYESGPNTESGTLSKSSRHSYEAQVMSECAILKQHDIPTNGLLVHFQTTLDEKTGEYYVSGYSGIFQFNTATQVNGQVQSLFQLSIPKSDIGDVNQPLAELFGSDTPVSKQTAGFIRSVDFFLDPKNRIIHTVDQNSEEGKQGFTHWFYDHIRNQMTYCRGTNDLKTKIEAYVKKLNETASVQVLNFGKDLAKTKSLKELETLAQNTSKNQRKEIVNNFKKYVLGGWTLVDEDTLLGNGLFIFQKDNRSEIVMIESSKPLHEEVPLGKGNTILGNIIRDDEVGADNRFYLNSNVGNLLLMKAAAYASFNANAFSIKKLSRITAFNLTTGEAINNTPLDTIAKNWQTLCFLRRNLNLRTISDLIYEPGKAFVMNARDFLSLNEDYDAYLKVFAYSPNDKDFTESQINEMLSELESKSKYGTFNKNLELDYKYAYAELYKALLYLRGQYHVNVESDVSKWFGKGVGFSGGFMSPFALSPSANLRTINELSITYSNKTAQRCQEVCRPWQKSISKLYDKNINRTIGGEWKFYENWFQKDSDENISKEFKLKDPRSDVYFLERPDEAEACKLFLDQMAKYRWGDDWEAWTDSEEYLEVPLVEPQKNLEVLESEGLVKGGIKVLKKRLREIAQVATETIVGSRQDVTRSTDEFANRGIPNPFFGMSHSEREEKLADKNFGPGYFEKNLDIVFTNVVVATERYQLGKQFVPLFTGLKVLLYMENSLNKAGMGELTQAVNSYIDSVVFNKSIIETGLLPIKKVINAFQGFVSKVTLGLSPRAFVREVASSTIRATWQLALKNPTFAPECDLDDYLANMAYAQAHIKDYFTVDAKDSMLNVRFRAANVSFKELQHNLQSNKYGIKNITDDFWFLTSTLPDFIHRMAFLKGTLQKLGAYDAYIMVNGDLVYDMSKDKRFNLLFKYATDGKFSKDDILKITDREEKLKWNNQWTTYLHSIEEWKKSSGEEVQIGDYLPEALDPTQQMNFKTQTDILYGNYDDESKSLMQKTLLGGMFFQFKTYGISRMIEWWKQGGTINIIRPIDYTEDGEFVYLVISTQDEINSGKNPITWKKESELTEEEINENRAIKHQEFAGIPNEGRIQSLYAVMFALCSGNTEDLQRLWNDPQTVANIALGLHDMWLMVLIAGLVRLLYGDEIIETMNEQDWWTRWSYAVLMGVAQDGPVWSVANSLWGDGKIPMWSALSKYATTAMSVINGNTYIWQGLTNTVGATREFSNYFARM